MVMTHRTVLNPGSSIFGWGFFQCFVSPYNGCGSWRHAIVPSFVDLLPSCRYDQRSSTTEFRPFRSYFFVDLVWVMPNSSLCMMQIRGGTIDTSIDSIERPRSSRESVFLEWRNAVSSIGSIKAATRRDTFLGEQLDQWLMSFSNVPLSSQSDIIAAVSDPLTMPFMACAITNATFYPSVSHGVFRCSFG